MFTFQADDVSSRVQGTSGIWITLHRDDDVGVTLLLVTNAITSNLPGFIKREIAARGVATRILHLLAL